MAGITRLQGRGARVSGVGCRVSGVGNLWDNVSARQDSYPLRLDGRHQMLHVLRHGLHRPARQYHRVRIPHDLGVCRELS